ncbi:MAG: hypothetical protein ACOCWM_00195 [Cyclobacteriaceae bacterium]
MAGKDKQIKAYLYPVTKRLTTGVYNPYLDNFMDSTGSFISYVNRQYPSNSGLFNILKFIFHIDLLFLNWAENIPDKKGGVLQSFFLIVLLRLRRILGIKIIWTLHNKISHSNEMFFLKKRLFIALLKESDFIITHSGEGIAFAESVVPGSREKIFYFPHPLKPQKPNKIGKKEFDILIWGTIAPYKGIEGFLAYLEDNDLLDKFRILISGKILSPEFYGVIKKYERSNIIIENRFVSDEELRYLIALSKAVLFTYSSNSVLSSGALIDSLSHRATVIGPNIGAFSEMGDLGIIMTYNNFDQLPQILESIIKADSVPDREKLEDFLDTHTWNHFAVALFDSMKQSNIY